jgi:hypothetical protein
MSLIDFTTAYRGGPSFFTGTGTTDLVPHIFPVALNGRPYLVDLRSGRFQHQYEQRVRDQSDISTAPGEASINPQGLWRRGSKSWHLGAGQYYGDDADAQDFRFYKSKGVNPWTKGQLSLLNATKLSLSSANTNLFTCTVKSSAGVEYLYVADGSTLKYTTNPFASSPTWTSVTTGSPGTAITGLETNGRNVYIGYTSHDIYYTTPGSASVTFFYAPNPDNGKTYYAFGYAKNRGFAANGPDIHQPALVSPTHAVFFDNPDTTFTWVGFAPGQNAIYAAGYSGVHSSVFKITIKADGTLDVPVVALELPVGEVVSAIHGYLGFILLGSNKGVRFCTTDSQNNLVAGPIIATGGSVYDFTEEDRFVWFTWTNYEGTSGLGRLDLSRFTQTNAPAYATDLMYSSTSAVKSVSTFASKRVFTIEGVGVVVEDTANLVASGTLETGYYTWGIPDRKFIPRFDVRFQPLSGTVALSTTYDNCAYVTAGSHSLAGDTEHTYLTAQERVIEAGYRLTLTRASAISGPVLTRWMARAYAAPRRSQIITLPVVLHEMLNIEGRNYFLDVEQERRLLESLVDNPRIVTYQERTTTFSVVVEDIEWMPMDTSRFEPVWEGTCVITMRTVAE